MEVHPPSAHGIICAYRLDANTPRELLPGQAVEAFRKASGERALWLHLDLGHPGARRWLREESGLDPLMAGFLMGHNPRPRVAVQGDQALISLRGPIRGSEPGHDDMGSLQIWTDGRRILTCRDRPSQAIARLRQALEHGEISGEVGDLLARLAGFLMEPLDDLIAAAEAETHRLGHAGAKRDTVRLVGELASLRRGMIRLGRHLLPQRRALTRLAASELTWLQPRDRRVLRSVGEQTSEYADTLRAALEIAEITQDEILQRSSERTEQRLYLLTVLSAIFMPLTFITGLLGVNLAGIPDAQDPLAFLVLCTVLLVILTALLWVLRRQDWL